MSIDPQIRRLALWWLAVNSTGVAISIFIERYIFYQGVKAGSFKYPPGSNEVTHIVWWLVYETVIGTLQVLTCCWLISLVKACSRLVRVTVGVTLGILTALLFPLVPVLIVNSGLWPDPLIGIYAFVLSGIVFGMIAGYARVTVPLFLGD